MKFIHCLRSWIVLVALFISSVITTNTGAKSNACESLLYSFAVSPDLNFLAVSGKHGVALWELAPQRRVLQSPMLGAVNFSPDSRVLIMTSQTIISLFDVISGKVIQTFDLSETNRIDLQSYLTKDNQYVLTTSHQRVVVRDTNSSQIVRRFPDVQNFISDTVPKVSNTGAFILIKAPEVRIRTEIWQLWDVLNNRLLGSWNTIADADFVPSDKGILTLSYLENRPVLSLLPFSMLNSAQKTRLNGDIWQFSPDGTSMVYGTFQRRVKPRLVQNIFTDSADDNILELDAPDAPLIYGFTVDSKQILTSGAKQLSQVLISNLHQCQFQSGMPTLVPSQYSFDGYNLYNSRLKREFVSIISTLTEY